MPLGAELDIPYHNLVLQVVNSLCPFGSQADSAHHDDMQFANFQELLIWNTIALMIGNLF